MAAQPSALKHQQQSTIGAQPSAISPHGKIANIDIIINRSLFVNDWFVFRSKPQIVELCLNPF